MRRRASPARDYGFSLIEVLAAFVVLMIIFAPFTGLFVTGFSGVFAAGHKTIATFLAQESADSRIAEKSVDYADQLAIEFQGVASISVEGGVLETSGESAGSTASATAFLPLVPLIEVVEPTPSQHLTGVEQVINVAVETRNVPNGTEISGEMLDREGEQPLGAPITGSNVVTDGMTDFDLTALDTLRSGNYIIRVKLQGYPAVYDYKPYVIQPAAYVAVGAEGTILVSADGVDWTPREVDGGFSQNLRAVDWKRGYFLAVGEEGTVATSVDGTNWLDQSSVINTNIALNGLTYALGYWFIVGDNGAIYRATPMQDRDATWAWQSLSTPTDAVLRDITFNGAELIAVGEHDGQGATVLYSADLGVTWSSADDHGMEDTEDISAVATGAVLLEDDILQPITFAVTKAGRIYRKAPGNAWTSEIAASGNELLGAWGQTDLFATAGSNGLVGLSPDASAWTSASTGTTETLNDIAWGDGNLVAVGSNGTIISSSDDGLTWTVSVGPTSNDLNGIAIIDLAVD